MLRYLGVLVLNLLAWVFVLMIPLLEMTACTMGSEDAWQLTIMLYAPIILLLSALLLLTTKIKWAKWLSLPQIVLIPWAIYVIFRYLVGVTIQQQHFCTVLKGVDFNYFESSWWAAYWAPAMLLSVALLCNSYWCVWRWGLHK